MGQKHEASGVGVVQAHRVTSPLVIDGALDESLYASTPASTFVQGPYRAARPPRELAGRSLVMKATRLVRF